MKKDKSIKLNAIRKKIDSIDDQIIKLVAKRFNEIKIKEKAKRLLSENFVRIYIYCLPGINVVCILYSKIMIETIAINKKNKLGDGRILV